MLFVALLLTACGNRPDYYYEVETEPTEVISMPESTPEPTPQVLTWQDAYAALLMEYAELPPMGEHFTRGFILYDIDKDGIPELIITRARQGFLDYPDYLSTEAIYTFRSNNVIRLRGWFSTYNSAFAPADNQPGIVVQSWHEGTRLLVIDGDSLAPKHNIFPRRGYLGEASSWYSWQPGGFIVITEEEYIELRDSFVPPWEEGELSERAAVWPADITETNIYNLVFGPYLPEFVMHIADFVPNPPYVTVQVSDSLEIGAFLLTEQSFRDEFISQYNSYMFFSHHGFGNIYDTLEGIGTTYPFTELVAFTASAPVRNFKYVVLDGSMISYEIGEVLYTTDVLLPEKPFITTWHTSPGGSRSQFGISFEDEEGVTRHYALNWNMAGYQLFSFYAFDVFNFDEFNATSFIDFNTWSFSYEHDRAFWADSPRAVLEGFNNTDISPTPITRSDQAFQMAISEVATADEDRFVWWSTVNDPETGMWKAQLGSWHTMGPAYTVYMNSDGQTTLIIDFSIDAGE